MHYNDFVIFFLRTPLHGLFSRSTLLITLTGRKSGRKIKTPVSYYHGDEQTLWVISSRDRTWWRNAIGGAPVTLHLRGMEVAAQAEAILDEQQVAAQLRDYIQHFPSMARYFSIQRAADGTLSESDVAREAAQRLFVKIDLLQVNH